MAGTFSNIFNPADADAADDTSRPFQPGAGDGTLPPDDGPDDGGPPPEIASGLEGSSDGDFGG